MRGPKGKQRKEKRKKFLQRTVRMNTVLEKEGEKGGCKGVPLSRKFVSISHNES
jgi:hypothetical protein